MEESNSIHPDYQKGFNEGYTIAKEFPELAEQLSKVGNETERLNGFRDGRNQLLAEKSRERLPSWLKGDRFKKSDNVPDKEIDKDQDRDIEPNR